MSTLIRADAAPCPVLPEYALQSAGCHGDPAVCLGSAPGVGVAEECQYGSSWTCCCHLFEWPRAGHSAVLECSSSPSRLAVFKVLQREKSCSCNLQGGPQTPGLCGWSLPPPAGVSLHGREDFMSFLAVVKNGMSSPAFSLLCDMRRWKWTGDASDRDNSENDSDDAKWN